MDAALEFTENECLWLLDHTSIFTEMPIGEDIDGMMLFRLKLLTSIVELGPNGGTTTLVLTRDEMWTALETAKFSAQIGTEPVGRNLITKLGKALISVSADLEVHSAVCQVGEQTSQEKPEPSRWDLKEKIDTWSKKPVEDD